jgi:hypothetical protein
MTTRARNTADIVEDAVATYATQSALTSGLGSKLDLAGGKILQIVRTTDGTLRTTTSTSYADVTGMTITITPQKSDSNLIIIADFGYLSMHTGTSSIWGQVLITDSSDNNLSGAQGALLGINGVTNSGQLQIASRATIIGYVNASTTASRTYKCRFRTLNERFTLENDRATAQMYAIEVSA